jgi:calcineurin-like phosphoesterase family protein
MYEDGYLDILVSDPEIKDGQRVTLCHYPMLSWYQSHRGAWQLFGHVHGRLDGSDKIMPTQLDIGVDSHNFTPLSWIEVKTIITKQCLKLKQ